MCGIIAFLLEQGSQYGIQIIQQGIQILQNRGYDSIGVSMFHQKGHIFWKDASTNDALAIKKLNQIIPEWNIDVLSGIAHTRWATHGAKTRENAHPHQYNKLIVVHNGILENYHELYIENETYLSTTDTEVIVHWFAKDLPDSPSVDDITKHLVKQSKFMNGTWALIIQHLDYPTHLWIMKHGSPLCLARNNDNWFCASEPNAIPTQKYYSFPESIICHIQNNNDIIDIASQSTINKIHWEHLKQEIGSIRTKNYYQNINSPQPFPHWLIREIYEQPDVIERAFNMGGRLPINSPEWVHLRGLQDVKLTEQIKGVAMVGCGTSLYASQWAAYWFRKLIPGFRVDVIDASEWDNDLWARTDLMYIFLSQSGETKDVHRAILNLKEVTSQNDTILLGVINVVESLIARELGRGVYCNAGLEHSVASTKSFTAQCIVLGQILLWVYSEIYQDKNIYFSKNESLKLWKTSLLNFPEIAKQMLYPGCDLQKQMKNLAQKLNTAQKCFCLGRGNTTAIAFEAALKLKEVSYIHAEGFVGGSLKHGPFSLIEPGTPIFIFSAFDEENTKKQILTAEETRSRGAFVIWISDYRLSNKQEWCVDEQIIINNKLKYWSSLACIFPIQLLAYEMAILRRINPDYPRNLAKVVSVDG